MISLGPISGQKYLQRGYNFTAGAVGAAVSDLLLLCIKLSERSAQSNLLTPRTRPQLASTPPIGGERQPATQPAHSHKKGRFCVNVAWYE